MLDSLLLPFRASPQAPALPPGYRLISDALPASNDLAELLQRCGEAPRPLERLERALQRSAWAIAVVNPADALTGFVRATSDRALNANLWDLCADPADPEAPALLQVLVHAALSRLRRDLPGCSISVAAAPPTLEALQRHGFVVDPGGIRAMGLQISL